MILSFSTGIRYNVQNISTRENQSKRRLYRVLIASSALPTLLGAQGQSQSRIDFSRYAVPGMCVAAASRRAPDLVRSVEYQHRAIVEGWNAADDSVVRLRAQVTARECGRRFTVANVAAEDRWDLLTLALLMQDDALARAVQSKLLEPTRAQGTGVQEITIARLVNAYGNANPPRYDEAEALLTPASLGALPAERRAVVLENAWVRLLAAASHRLDRPRMRVYAERIVAGGKDIPHYAVALPDDVAKELGVPLAGIDQDSLWNNATAVTDYANRQLGFLQQTDTSNVKRDVALASAAKEDSTLALNPTEWFPAKPPSGAPTLVLSLNASWGDWSDGTWSDGNIGCVSNWDLHVIWRTFGMCQGPDAWLHMLARDYIPKGLSVVVAMSANSGVAFNSASFAPLSPSEAVQREVWYFRTHRAYPVSMAMYENTQYHGPPALFRDAAGKVLYNGPVSSQLATILAQFMRAQ